MHDACKGTSEDKLKQFNGKEGAALLSLSHFTAYHNDSVTFPDKEQTKTLPTEYRSAWSFIPMAKTTSEISTDAQCYVYFFCFSALATYQAGNYSFMGF